MRRRVAGPHTTRLPPALCGALGELAQQAPVGQGWLGRDTLPAFPLRYRGARHAQGGSDLQLSQAGVQPDRPCLAGPALRAYFREECQIGAVHGVNRMARGQGA
jgi:hypothetical protein